MADIHNQTTSSKSLDENYISNQKASSPVNKSEPPMPKGGVAEAEYKPKVAQNLSESYQIVKRRQQKYYNDLSKENIPETVKQTDSDGGDVVVTTADSMWQEVCSAKNKLKRKKKLSASLTSVTDSVNQEKRTRIEGMQLNCRGKLQGLHEKVPLTPPSIVYSSGAVSKAEKLTTKPPLPQTAKVTTPQVAEALAAVAVNKVSPPRLKRKLQENIQTIQKLNALTEQLRLEINELKSSLTTERGAVRVLRAQNESETRKWKNEVKKLQNAIELLKRNNSNNNSAIAMLPNNAASKKLLELSAESLPINAAASSLATYEIQRLTNEIMALKEAHKVFDEKKMINCDADRRKAADMRTLKDSYEIRLTQIQKSAKTEISRLLEEIKTKERNIGQLKKDMQILQNKPSLSQHDVKSRNATTTNLNFNTTTTNKTTNKPKKIGTTPQKKIINKPTNELFVSPNAKKEEQQQQQEKKAAAAMPSQVQQPNEMKKLKDIELINNTKNLQNNNVNNNNLKTTKILTTSTTTNTTNTTNTQQALKLKMLDNENHHKSLINDENFSNNLLKTTTCAQQQKEYHSLPHELTERLLATTTGTPMGMERGTKSHTQQENDRHREYRTKDNNNSDSDSALSSAPPSISPQPPPAGLETADIWQMIRTYTTDIEKMQKDIESLQKENEQLHTELNLAKEQIVESEKIAMEFNNNKKLKQLLERIKYLEEQEHQLEAEANELREQNELLEFRILELEENNDKWSLHSHATPSSTTSSTTTSQTVSVPTTKDVWACGGGGLGSETGGCCKSNKNDPMQMLFGNSINMNMDSGITSPHNQHHTDDDLNLMDASNEDLRRRINNLLKKSMLDEEDKHCLQQVLTLVQQLDLLSQRSSGPDSLNTVSCSSDDANSLDFVKSRISDYSSASSSSASSPSSAARPTYENIHNTNNNSKNSSKSTAQNSNSSSSARIVATVQPYNSSPQHSSCSNSNSSNSPYHHHHHHQQQHVPTNTPTDSPRKTRHTWQSSSLSESGVFVESDFLSDVSENNACTQTDFDDAKEYCCSEFQKFQPSKASTAYLTSASLSPRYSPASNSSSQEKRLQYYKERLEVLERKVLIYESSGDLQAKHLADRLQREIQLEKELKELRDRVEFLESENSTLEEEKCEFEEAENDTRLRLQRLEVELEILSQRNVELEMSREALSAKYKDCRSECLILRDDLSASETQIRHLEEDKQKAKENLEFLHNALPLLLIYNSVLAAAKLQQQPAELLALAPPQKQAKHNDDNIVSKMGNYICPATERLNNMMPLFPGNPFAENSPAMEQFECDESALYENSNNACTCQYLKQELSVLRNQIKDLNTHHYEALESADSHWVEIEREYKDREESFRAKECCLKQKIGRLQDCLRDDARAANEKIQQLEECEKELKTCLLRITKEHRDLLQDHETVIKEADGYREQFERMGEQMKPLQDSIEQEKKRSKTLNEELNFMRKMVQETETRSANEMESLRTQLFNLKKEFLHIEVTNSELKEEVFTLEGQLKTLQNNEKDCVDKIRCLSDEVRTKEEMCQKLEKRLERSEGYSLAQELNGSPSKRFKREEVKDLKSASAGLGNALRNIKDCDIKLPSHQHFKSVARDVKRLADALLGGEPVSEEEAPQSSPPKLILTEITQI